ncbi:MAG TPA: DUF2252 domain-containing protein [Thermoanaerobaculaceae bacterium]|nr:DUF2252 domain-containing protein [Thermoanaerobaculaceae bacterium]
MSAGEKLPVRSSRRPGRVGSESHKRPVQPRSRADHYAAGKALRAACPRDAHAAWKAPSDRRDAVELILEAEKGRMPDLLPLRHGRMVRSAFTFYRGAALTMAADLASTPSSGIRVQACGDAHLCNFGGFATPERKIIFSINDLDETLPAPWEWDVKRLAASFVVACRDKGLKDSVAKDVVLTCVRSYREGMAEFSQMKTLELWYRALGADELIAGLDPNLRKRAVKRIAQEQAKSRGEEMFPKLVEHKGDKPVIKDQLPTIFHAEGHPPGEVQQAVHDTLAAYRATLPGSYQSLLDRYELRDAAIKVVGVGSVGTLCWVLLFTAGEGDPLFLQVKEARASVLEPYAGPSVFPNNGQRVVNGYRLMQPASDIFLGWSQGPKRHYFFRQLRDMKISIMVETFGQAEMDIYAGWCARALALSHARAGNSAMLSGYMGKSDAFDRAIAAFSVAYADQNEKDHAALDRAVRKGKVKAVFEENR